MKTKYLLLVGMVVVLASCSSAYRNGQTPDDVYYSPAPAAEAYVVKNNSDERNSYRNRNSDGYSYTEEREIRQAIQNPRYRNSISFGIGMGGYFPYSYNSFGYNTYGYNPFGYNPYGYNSFGYNPYWGIGYYDPFGYNPYYSYNPYYPSYGYNPHYGNSYYPPANYYPVPSKSSSNRGARIVNLGAYTPPGTTAPRGITTPSKNGVFRPAPIAPVRTFESRTTPPVRKERSGLGSEIRRVFTPSDKRSDTPPANNNSRTERNNTPPVRRFDPPVRNTQPPVRSNNTPPVRNSTPPVRSTNNPPVRTFDPSPAPAISTPAPSASSRESSSSTPVRTFRNNK